MRANLSLLLLSGIIGVIAELDESPKLLHIPFTRKTVHSHHSLTHSKRDGAYTSSLYNSMQSIYLITVSIGTPAQSFQLVADTGSSDIWVAGSECPENICPVTRFVESSSTTYANANAVFNITYGVGQAAGNYAKDTITVGGATISNQQFGIATSTAEIYPNVTSYSNSSSSATYNSTTTTSYTLLEGVFGLAYPGITSAEQQYNPFFFNLISQNIISNPVFSIYLNSSQALGDSGEIIFGGEDSTKYTGSIYYLPVFNTPFSPNSNRASDRYGYWGVYSQGFGVLNGVKGNVNLETNKAFRLLVDTGNTLTRIPKDVLSAFILASVGSNNVLYDESTGYYQISCAAAQTDIMFQVQLTNSLSMTSNPLILNIPIADLIIPVDTYDVSTASACLLGITPTESTVILGETVLRSFYLIFDAGQNRIGFAPAVTSNATITGNTAISSSNSSSSSSNNSSNGPSSNSNRSSVPSQIQPCILLSLAFIISLLF